MQKIKAKLDRALKVVNELDRYLSASEKIDEKTQKQLNAVDARILDAYSLFRDQGGQPDVWDKWVEMQYGLYTYSSLSNEYTGNNEKVRNQKGKRGGKREGAGRDLKFAGRKSKPVRIPEDYIPFVQLLISELDKHPALGFIDSDKPLEFDPIAIISKSGHRQQVRFFLEKLNNDKGDVRFPRIIEEDTGRVNAKGKKLTKSKLVVD